MRPRALLASCPRDHGASTTTIESGTFGGLPIRDVPDDGEWPADPTGYAWRVSGSFEDNCDEDLFTVQFHAALEELAAQPWAGEVRSLVFGAWDVGYIQPPNWEQIVEQLRTFGSLENFYLGDIPSEEAEVTWIRWGNPAPALSVLPGLKMLCLRGCAEACEISDLALGELEILTVDGGGLLDSVLTGVLDADLPKLHGLSLPLGARDYTDVRSADQLEPLLSGRVHAGVRMLGLRNSWIQDEVVEALLASGRLATIEWLDLGGGALTDRGGKALVEGDLGAVKELQISWHYMSDEVVAQLRAAHPGVSMSIEDAQDAEDFGDGPEYFTEVGE